MRALEQAGWLGESPATGARAALSGTGVAGAALGLGLGLLALVWPPKNCAHGPDPWFRHQPYGYAVAYLVVSGS